MKLKKVARSQVAVLLLFFLSSPGVAKGDYKLLRGVAYTNALFNWPASFIVGGGVRVSEVLQLGAGVAPLEWAIGALAKKEDFIWGAHALLVLPLGFIAPIVGLGYTQRRLDAADSSYYGHRKGTFHYLTPAAGIELRVLDRLGIQLGLVLAKKKTDGHWKKNGPNSGVLPFIMAQLLF